MDCCDPAVTQSWGLFRKRFVHIQKNCSDFSPRLYKVVLGNTLCKLCSTKYFGKAFLCKCICVSSVCVQKLSAPNGLCAWNFPLTVRAFWRAEKLRWVETNFEEMRNVDQCSDEMKTVEKNLLGWHVRRDGMRWEELTWFEVRWSVECEVQVWSAKCRVWSVLREVFAWRCIAPGSRAGHVLGQHQCNSFAQSTHARAWLAHGACKFYRWQRFFSITLRQLPPRLVRVLWVIIYIYST